MLLNHWEETAKAVNFQIHNPQDLVKINQRCARALTDWQLCNHPTPLFAVTAPSVLTIGDSKIAMSCGNQPACIYHGPVKLSGLFHKTCYTEYIQTQTYVLVHFHSLSRSWITFAAFRYNEYELSSYPRHRLTYCERMVSNGGSIYNMQTHHRVYEFATLWIHEFNDILACCVLVFHFTNNRSHIHIYHWVHNLQAWELSWATGLQPRVTEGMA